MMGKLLRNKLDASQLDVQIGAGTIELKDLFLNTDLLNSHLKNSPIQLLSAYVGSVKIEIPWTDLWNGHVKISMDAFTCEVIPLLNVPFEDLAKYGSSLVAELAQSVGDFRGLNAEELKGQMQLFAQLRENLYNDTSTRHDAKVDPTDSSTEQGVEMLSGLVESLLSRIEIRINDTVIWVRQPDVDEPGKTIFLKVSLQNLTYEGDEDEDLIQHREVKLWKKRLTFRGFYIQLYHRRSSSLPTELSQHERSTILHGDMDQDCLFKVRFPIEGATGVLEGPRAVTINGFIRNIRGCLDAKQLVLLQKISSALGISSHIASKLFPQKEKDPNLLSSDEESEGDVDPPIFWNLDITFVQSAIVLLEDSNAQVSPSWWLTPAPRREFSTKEEPGFHEPLQFLPAEPIIPDLKHHHITCDTQDVTIHIQQMQQKAIVNLSIGHFEISEFLHHREILLQCDKKLPPSVMYKRRVMEFFSPSSENEDLDMSSSLNELYQSTHRSMFSHIQMQMESTQVSDTTTDTIVSVEIRPLLVDLDPGLLLRMQRFAKGMKSPSKFSQFKFDKPKTDSKGHKVTRVDAPSIDIRFSGWNYRSLSQSYSLRDENVIIHFNDFSAESDSAKHDCHRSFWNLSFESMEVFQYWEGEKRLVSRVGTAILEEDGKPQQSIRPSLYLYTNSEQELGASDGLNEAPEEVHYRWWEEHDSGEMTYPKGDREASSLEFQKQAERLAPSHIELDCPSAIVCMQKKEYDLFMEIYTESLDIIDKFSQQKPPGPDRPENGLNESIYYSQDEEENEEMFHSIIDPKTSSCVRSVDVHNVSNSPPEDMFHSMIEADFEKKDPGKAPPRGPDPSSSSQFLEKDGEQFYSAILNPSSNQDMFYSTILPSSPRNNDETNENNLEDDLNESILIHKDAVLNQFTSAHDSDSESASPDFENVQASEASESPFVSSLFIHCRQLLVDFNEDPDKNSEERLSFEPGVSTKPPQTFRFEFRDIKISLVGKKEKHNLLNHRTSTVTYLSLRAMDIVLSEYSNALRRFSNLVHNPDHPLLDTYGECIPLFLRTMAPRISALHSPSSYQEKDVFHVFTSLRLHTVLAEEKEHNYAKTFSVINLRGLSHIYQLDTEWTLKLSEFFTVVNLSKRPKEGKLNDLTNLFINLYDVSVDFNPPNIPSRFVMFCEKIKLTCNIITLSPMFSFAIEIRDAALFLIDECSKRVLAPMHVHRNLEPRKDLDFSPVLGPIPLFGDPILHRVAEHVISDHLERQGFVRAMTITWLEVFVDQDRTTTFNDVTITGGEIAIGTCRDSLQTLKGIIEFLADYFIVPPSIDEVDFLLPEQEEEVGSAVAQVFKLDESFSAEEGSDPVDGISIAEISSPERIADGFGLAMSPPRESSNISSPIETGEPFMMRPSLRSSLLHNGPLSADPFSSPIQEKKNVEFNLEYDDEPDLGEDLAIDNANSPPDIDLADMNADPMFNPIDGHIIAKEPMERKKKVNIFRGIDDHMFGDDEPSGFGISDAESEEEQEVIINNAEEAIGGARIIQDYANSVSSSASNVVPPLPESPKRQTSFKADKAGVWFENPSGAEKEKVMIDDYVVPEAKSENLHPYLTSSYPKPKNKLAVKDLSIFWTFYGGNDWPENSNEREERESEPVVAMHSYEDTEEIGPDIQGIKNYVQKPRKSDSSIRLHGPQRCLHDVLQLRLEKLSVFIYQFGKKESVANRIVFRLRTLEIRDQLEKSGFKKMLSQHRGVFGAHDEIDQLSFSMDIVRPDPVHYPNREEARIRVNILPIRLNVDQHAVDFLKKYFVPDLQQSMAEPSESGPEADAFSVHRVQENIGDLKAQKSEAPFFIQDFSINPVVLCIDYKPRHVDFSQLSDGDYSQLIHLFPLCKVEIVLQRFTCNGIKGADRLAAELAKFWANDIARHQAHRYLSGVQPIRSVVNVGAGMADLIICPYKQFRDDGRVLKGLERGAFSFVKSITIEALHVGSGAFSTASKLLGTVDAAVDHATSKKKAKRRRRPFKKQNKRKQPLDAYEGIMQAYESLSQGLIDAGEGIIAVPRQEYRRSGVIAATKSVLRGIPLAILRPVMGATEAVSVALTGLGNAVNPPEMDAD